ncbi:adenine DNA glycosylase isoform X2 [Anabrus simplex]|uniref:adenine DNA glycosylase isoform X2 n=1 Tax=Anabrus simplex TaxID=316456 RepID=UPI0035A2D2C9
MKRKSKLRERREPVSKNEDEMLAADEMRNSAVHRLHQFTAIEVATFRSRLLDWYNQNGRDLPWRTLARNSEAQQKAYAVLVSEVMLQQTQVATVEQYYKKWMARWPTFEHLASASHEEVNEMWSGLGYYARGKRLFEAAKRVMTDLGGKVPESSVQLQKLLPGVGRYTAGAVASIAFGERVPAVDGNVIRVLSRLRLIGGNSDSQVVVKDIWDIAETVVDPEQPGPFNEAMMDFGATVCTVKTPTCSSCPLNGICLSYKLTVNEQAMKNLANKEYSLLPDIEIVPDCRLCLPPGEWDLSLGVKNFPRKSKKAPPKEENYVVGVLHRKMNNLDEEEYFMVKRPKEGLLASMWEFPSFSINLPTQPKVKTVLLENLETCHGVKRDNVESSSYIGEVKHIFSHLHHTYMIYDIKLTEEFSPLTSTCYQDQQWVSEQQFPSIAMSTGVKKIFKTFITENMPKV